MSKFKKELFNSYRWAKAKINAGLKPKGRQEINKYKMKEKIDRCLANLEDPYATFIKNTLILDDKLWWIDSYPKTTYYRYLKISTDKFFQLFYKDLGGTL